MNYKNIILFFAFFILSSPFEAQKGDEISPYQEYLFQLRIVAKSAHCLQLLVALRPLRDELDRPLQCAHQDMPGTRSLHREGQEGHLLRFEVVQRFGLQVCECIIKLILIAK